MKNLLFIGDVVGKAGCDFLTEKLGALKRAHDIDITIVNGENSAQGNGITRVSAEMLVRAGADVITTGNHAFRHKDAMELFEYDYIVRPANFPEGGCVGSGVRIMDMGAYSVAVVNLMGTVYMDPLDNPFSTMDKLLSEMARREKEAAMARTNGISTAKATRSARFRTSVTLIVGGVHHFFDGVMEGHIATEKHGKGGFGYDPIFVPEGYTQTNAELGDKVKNAISHRSKALRAMAEFLKK